MRWIGIIGHSVQGTCIAARAGRLPSHTLTFYFQTRRSRRLCSGIHLAERQLWLAVSQLLWAFDIRSLPDEPISVEGYNGESARKTKPFRVTLTPRHDRVQALLEVEEEVSLMK
jgi:hypothetical protein